MAKPSLNVVTITCGVVKEWHTVLIVVTITWNLADMGKAYCDCCNNHLRHSKHIQKPLVIVVPITCSAVNEWQTVMNVVRITWSVAGKAY